jgi:hypothetical protein
VSDEQSATPTVAGGDAAGWVTVHRGELSLSVIEEIIRGHDPAEAASILYWRIFRALTGQGGSR